MHHVGGSKTTRLYDGSRRNPRGPSQGSINPTRGGIGGDKLEG